jgi:hypothetical protein
VACLPHLHLGSGDLLHELGDLLLDAPPVLLGGRAAGKVCGGRLGVGQLLRQARLQLLRLLRDGHRAADRDGRKRLACRPRRRRLGRRRCCGSSGLLLLLLLLRLLLRGLGRLLLLLELLLLQLALPGCLRLLLLPPLLLQLLLPPRLLRSARRLLLPPLLRLYALHLLLVQLRRLLVLLLQLPDLLLALRALPQPAVLVRQRQLRLQGGGRRAGGSGSAAAAVAARPAAAARPARGSPPAATALASPLSSRHAKPPLPPTCFSCRLSSTRSSSWASSRSISRSRLSSLLAASEVSCSSCWLRCCGASSSRPGLTAPPCTPAPGCRPR